jgi:hypothetical protein
VDWAKVLEGEEAPKSEVTDATKLGESDGDDAGTIEPEP